MINSLQTPETRPFMKLTFEKLESADQDLSRAKVCKRGGSRLERRATRIQRGGCKRPNGNYSALFRRSAVRKPPKAAEMPVRGKRGNQGQVFRRRDSYMGCGTGWAMTAITNAAVSNSRKTSMILAGINFRPGLLKEDTRI